MGEVITIITPSFIIASLTYGFIFLIVFFIEMAKGEYTDVQLTIKYRNRLALFVLLILILTLLSTEKVDHSPFLLKDPVLINLLILVRIVLIIIICVSAILIINQYDVDDYEEFIHKMNQLSIMIGCLIIIDILYRI